MYVEEIITKRNGKEYRTLLVRESFREGSTVSHRTIANISHLPQGCIEGIKRYLKGQSVNPDVSGIQISDSKEYGASQSVLSFARKIELDKMICLQKVQWREDVLAMIVGKLLYSCHEASLINMYADTVLWESCGHLPGIRPDIHKHCYIPLNKLLSKQHFIQKKITDEYLQKESVALLFLTDTFLEEEKEHGDCSFFNHEDCKLHKKKFITALLTNLEGCPVGIKIFLSVNEEQKEIYEQLKIIINKLTHQPVVLIGNSKIFTSGLNHEFEILTGLTVIQKKKLIEQNIIFSDQFFIEQFYEVADPADPSIRYILYVNHERRNALENARNELITKVKERLRKIQKKNQNIAEEIKKVWESFNVENFFDWHIEEGQLHFSVNILQLNKEHQLDGCHIIQTNVKKEDLSAKDIANSYQKLNEIQSFFSTVKITPPKPHCFSLEERIQAHSLLYMLSYYLQWNINKKLVIAWKTNEEMKNRQWTFTEVVERLKSIRSQTIRIGGETLETVKTNLDEEQRKIISALGVTLVAKLSK